MSQLTMRNFFRKETIRSQGAWVLWLMVWSAAVGFGFSRLFLYEAAPAKISSEIPVFWPSGSRVTADANRPVLLMFAHPQCPCSRASVSELEKIMTVLQGKIQAYVFFARPRGFSEAKVKSGLWKHAERIPGVQVVLDEGNKEAALFSSKTSGETFLYGTQGKLLFHGGITGSRGHEGANPGSDIIKDLIVKGTTEAGKAQTSVFGCSLWDAKTRRDLNHES